MHGRISHIEIPCKYIKRAKGFYSNGFKWIFKDTKEKIFRLWSKK